MATENPFVKLFAIDFKDHLEVKKSGKHGNNIRHSQLIHLPNMSILTMLEAYSNNLHELATVY